jgi:predicted naringenin-chalcone synthase
MSDYAQITTFITKDSLLTGNPAKAVKGAELDAELAAIAVAILTKYDSTDLSDQATAEAGTNNTALMTPLRAAQFAAAYNSTQAKYKTLAETVSNSSTLQDDDELANFVIAASGVYAVRGILICQIKAASDLKICLTLGSAPTAINIAYVGIGSATGASAMSRLVQVSNGSGGSITSTSDESMVITLDGIINANAATTMKLQWAQAVGVVENTIMSIGSFIEITKIA